jgi:hypothetical protein
VKAGSQFACQGTRRVEGRAAQFQFEIGENGALKQSVVDNAIEEMVFSGGSLILKLLGGSSTDLSSASDNQILPSRPQ